jgi:outer membrane murein-binding lipoprotein Lpp
VNVGSVLATGGTGAVVTGIIAWMARLLIIADRRSTAELKRVNETHDEEIAELKSDLAALRTKVDELEARVDEERELRRAAEDRAAAAERRAGGGGGAG